jgi:hypothetical protein
MSERKRFTIIFIAVNLGVLIWTPFYAGRMPLKLELSVGLISAIWLNLLVYFLMRKKMRKQGQGE